MGSIAEYVKYLDLGDHGDEFLNYSYSDTISDAMTEIADGNIDIYNQDLYNFISEEPNWVEEAISEFGWNGVGSTLVGAAQMGQLVKYERDLYDNLDDCIKNVAYNYLQSDLELDEIPDELIESIDEWATDIDSDEKIGFLNDKIDEWIEENPQETWED